MLNVYDGCLKKYTSIIQSIVFKETLRKLSFFIYIKNSRLHAQINDMDIQEELQSFIVDIDILHHF